MLRVYSIFFVFLCLWFFVSNAVADEELIPLSVSVNTAEKGDYFVVLRNGITVLINQKDLAPLGFVSLSADEEIDGQTYVNLDNHSDYIVYDINPGTLTLHMEVNAFYLKKFSKDLAGKTIVKSNAFKVESAYLNASANIRGVDDGSYRAMEYPLEAVISAHDLLLQTHFTYLREDIDKQFVTGIWYRGMSNITKDFSQKLERLVLGDYVAGSGELGGSGVFAGISYGKQFNMATRFTKYSSLSVDGVLKTPSKVNLYANGNLIRSEQLPAGVFELENLPDLYGAGELELEITDAFGRVTRRTLDYYVSTRLLRKGLHEFSYSLGFKRSELNKADYEYASQATALGFHRYGVNEYLTAGFRFEAEPDFSNYGPSLNILLGSLGDIELKAARSERLGTSAYSRIAKYNYSSNRFHFRLAYRRNDQQYSTISSVNNLVWPSEISSAGIGVHGSKIGGLSLSYTKTNFYFDLPQEIISLNYSNRLGKKTTFFIRAQNLKHGDTETNSVFAAISVVLDKQVSTSASYGQNAELKEVGAYLQKAAPIGEGSGFRFRTRRVSTDYSDKEYPGEINVIAKTRYNVLNATYFKEETLSSYNAQFATTLAFVDNQFFFTRPIIDSFSLVKVGDLDRVKVFYSNELVGQTKNGRLLIPSLASYTDNYISIDAEDIPVDYAIRNSRKLISPKYRNGSVADFDVERFQGVGGILYIAKADILKTADYAGLQISHGTRRYQSIVGKGGEFYFENLSVGSYRAQVMLEGEFCEFALEIPRSNEMLIDLGEFTCEM